MAKRKKSSKKKGRGKRKRRQSAKQRKASLRNLKKARAARGGKRKSRGGKRKKSHGGRKAKSHGGKRHRNRHTVYASLIAKGYSPERANKVTDRFMRLQGRGTRAYFEGQTAAEAAAASRKQMADFWGSLGHVGKFHANVTR